MTGLQKKRSASWAISAGLSFAASKKILGAGTLGLTLFDVENQLFIPLTLYGISLGGGLSGGASLSTFSPTFFTTPELWAGDFNGRATVAEADLTVGVGASAAYVTFWNVDHDPYWLDIGGLQVGVSGGISAGISYAHASIDNAKRNGGCLIAPGGDPLCGGSSAQETRESPAYQSAGR
ncbi:MAG: hypothetical protein ACJ72Z_05705 [Pyrinomonadaceae bacterium]